jgi:hypothetical protein
MLQAARADIEQHFLSAISEVAGKEVDHKAFQLAIKTGWI